MQEDIIEENIMEEDIIEETVEFSEELYQKNIEENSFAEPDEFDGIGVDEDENN